MKKILSLILLGALLFSFSGVLAQGVPGPDSTPNECCVIGHDFSTSPLAGDTAGPAKNAVIGPETDSPCSLTTNALSAFPNSWAGYCTVDTVYTITDWIFWVTFVIGGVIIIIGGIMIMVSGGNPEKAKSARALLTYGVIGIVIALVARAIPALARFVIGM